MPRPGDICSRPLEPPAWHASGLGRGCAPRPFVTLLGVRTSGGGAEADAEAGRKGQGRDACGCNRGEGPNRGRESQGQQVRAGGEAE